MADNVFEIVARFDAATADLEGKIGKVIVALQNIGAKGAIGIEKVTQAGTKLENEFGIMAAAGERVIKNWKTQFEQAANEFGFVTQKAKSAAESVSDFGKDIGAVADKTELMGKKFKAAISEGGMLFNEAGQQVNEFGARIQTKIPPPLMTAAEKARLLKQRVYESGMVFDGLGNKVSKTRLFFEKLGQKGTEALKSIDKIAGNLGNSLRSIGSQVSLIGNNIGQLGRRGLMYMGALGGAITGVAGGIVKIQSSFEDAFANVQKTVNATDEEFRQIRADIIALSEEIPVSTEEIANLVSVAGQLGIQGRDNLMNFARTAALLGRTTDMSSEEAVQGLSALITICQGSADEVDNLGSALNSLGASSNAGEKDILNMSLRVAGAGHAAGMSEQQILALSTTLAGMRVDSEMGGSALSRLITQFSVMAGKALDASTKTQGLTRAQENLMRRIEDTRRSISRAEGDFRKLNAQMPKTAKEAETLAGKKETLSRRIEDLRRNLGYMTADLQKSGTQMVKNKDEWEDFARVAGMTGKQFAALYRKDAYAALTKFFEGLDKARKGGQDLNTTISKLGIEEVRERDAILRMASAWKDMTGNLQTANLEYQRNLSLIEEAKRRFVNFSGTVLLAWNKVKAMFLDEKTGMDLLAPLTSALKEELIPALERVKQYLIENKDEIKAWTTEKIEWVIAKVKELGKMIWDNREKIVEWGKSAVTWLQENGLWMAKLFAVAAVVGPVLSMVGGALSTISAFLQIISAIKLAGTLAEIGSLIGTAGSATGVGAVGFLGMLTIVLALTAALSGLYALFETAHNTSGFDNWITRLMDKWELLHKVMVYCYDKYYAILKLFGNPLLTGNDTYRGLIEKAFGHDLPSDKAKQAAEGVYASTDSEAMREEQTRALGFELPSPWTEPLPISIPGMSSGGVVPGPSGAGDIIPRWLEPGEAVIRAPIVKSQWPVVRRLLELGSSATTAIEAAWGRSQAKGAMISGLAAAGEGSGSIWNGNIVMQNIDLSKVTEQQWRQVWGRMSKAMATVGK